MQVRVDAVAALRNLVEAFDDDHLDSIKPLLPELLTLLFALMVEVMAAPCCPCCQFCHLYIIAMCSPCWLPRWFLGPLPLALPRTASATVQCS